MALSQFLLLCPAVDPDAEEIEVNVDEFEHTEVEQQARRDQQRVLAALARHRRQPVPMADFDLHGPVGCPARALLNQAVDFCSATSVVMDSTTTSPAPSRDASTEGTRKSRERATMSHRRRFNHLTPKMATTPPADPPYPPVTRYRSGRHRPALSAVAPMSEV